MEFKETGPRRLIAVDLDGTLNNGEPFWVTEPTPNLEVIERVREFYRQGNIICVWTARQWNTAPETVAWLIKHQVPFHGIMMGKGGADLYVDDKAISPNIFVDSLVTIEEVENKAIINSEILLEKQEQARKDNEGQGDNEMQ